MCHDEGEHGVGRGICAARLPNAPPAALRGEWLGAQGAVQ